MRDEPIPDPDVEALGPAMLALTPLQRRFVVGWIGARGKNASRVARAAGYSDSSGAAKVVAHHLLQNPKVRAALREEADRRLDGTAVLAVLALGDLLNSKDDRIKQTAVDSVLDRTGFSRKTTQDIRVERVDGRTTEELMRLVEQWRPGQIEKPKAQIVDADFVEVPRGATEKAG